MPSYFLDHLSVNFIRPYGFSIFHTLAYLELYKEIIIFIKLLEYS